VLPSNYQMPMHNIQNNFQNIIQNNLQNFGANSLPNLRPAAAAASQLLRQLNTNLPNGQQRQ